MKLETVSAINTKRLTIWYILALSMVGLLTLLGQFAVQHFLQRLQGDARIVNIAGRQRMLSQRLPLLVQSIQSMDGTAISADQKKLQLVELSSQLRLWEESHRALQHGSLAVGLQENDSPTISRLFEDIAPHFSALDQIISGFLNDAIARGSTLPLSAPEVEKMLRHSQDFLNSMDQIVSQYEREAGARVESLRRFEYGLLVATLIILIAEGILIFSPAISSLRRAFSVLQITTDRLRESTIAAERANAAKTDFLTRVSHELRTPLHGLLGVMELLAHTKLSTSQRTRLELATEASQNLHRLVDDLLDMSALESGAGIHLQPNWISLESTVRSVLALMETTAQKKNLTISCEICEGIPQAVFVDGDRLKQVLGNLLQNAIRYTSIGSVGCRVFSRASHSAGQDIRDSYMDGVKDPDVVCLEMCSFHELVFEVFDTGCGIAKADQARIFESFVRLEQVPDNSFGEGLGLGLSITNSILKLMNSELSIDSDCGKGSTFRFVLKVAGRDDVHLNVTKPRYKTSPKQKCCRERILIVDDSKINRLLLRDYLRLLEIRSRAVGTLKAAQRVLRRFQFDVLLLDRQLPDGDGVEFLRELTRTLDVLPQVYLITADVNTLPVSIEQLPIAGVLHKPVSLSELANALAIQQIPTARSATIVAETNTDFETIQSTLRSLVIEGLTADIAELERALEDSNFDYIRLLSHRMRGSAANARMTSLSDLLLEMEENAINRSPAAFRLLLNKLKNIHLNLISESVNTR